MVLCTLYKMLDAGRNGGRDSGDSTINGSSSDKGDSNGCNSSGGSGDSNETTASTATLLEVRIDIEVRVLAHLRRDLFDKEVRRAGLAAGFGLGWAARTHRHAWEIL